MIKLVLFGKARLYMGRVWCDKKKAPTAFLYGLIGASVDKQF